MCKVMEDMRNEAARDGAKKAVAERNVEIALDMIKDGQLTYEQIAQYSRLAIERVKELAVPKVLR